MTDLLALIAALQRTEGADKTSAGRSGGGRGSADGRASVLDKHGPAFARASIMLRFVRTHAHAIAHGLMGVFQCALTMPDASYIREQVTRLLTEGATPYKGRRYDITLRREM